MVLIVLCSMLFSFCDQDNALTNKYAKDIKKSISKAMGISQNSLHSKNFIAGELSLIKSMNNKKGYILISEVAACNLGGCTNNELLNEAHGKEYFDLLLLTDLKGDILDIKILDYFSDYGYEITSKKYLKKFKGKNLGLFAKNTDGIDAISGATISCYALEGILELLHYSINA